MKPFSSLGQIGRIALLIAATALAACDNDDPDPAPVPPPTVTPPPPPPTVTFEVEVVNLTNAQPLSPVALIAHDASFTVFTVGEPASAGLEELAEDGSNATLLAEADGAGAFASVSGAGPIGPGGSETLTLEFEEADLDGATLSVSTMLVNTNDAISGTNGYPIAGMAVGDSTRLRAIAYDAGTEANTEEAVHIPGPAGGGEGFNAARDDRADRVTMHAGVVGNDDGFATSDLTNQHRFDNPVLEVRIARIN